MFRFMPAAPAAARGQFCKQIWTSGGAKFGNPAIFVLLVEWADRIITE